MDGYEDMMVFIPLAMALDGLNGLVGLLDGWMDGVFLISGFWFLVSGFWYIPHWTCIYDDTYVV